MLKEEGNTDKMEKGEDFPRPFRVMFCCERVSAAWPTTLR